MRLWDLKIYEHRSLCGVTWLLLTALETLTKENDWLGGANCQVKAQWESWRPSGAALRRLSSFKASGHTVLRIKPRISLYRCRHCQEHMLNFYSLTLVSRLRQEKRGIMKLDWGHLSGQA